mgnify:CR=1 FL=1
MISAEDSLPKADEDGCLPVIGKASELLQAVSKGEMAFLSHT